MGRSLKVITVTARRFKHRRSAYFKKLKLRIVDKVIITCHGWPVYQVSRLKRTK